MGKRRTVGPHRDRHAEEDDDDDIIEEENIEEEPLRPEQVESIKSRKKLIAKRRVAGVSESGLTPFGALSAVSAASENSSESTATSVFSGFKGFGAYKPSTGPSSTTETRTPLSLSNGAVPKPPATSSFFSSSSSTAAPKLTFESSTAPPPLKFTSSLFASKPAESATAATTTKPASTTNGLEADNHKPSSNIGDTELNFITELNELYERCYGPNKRVYKLPNDVLNGELDAETTDSTDSTTTSKDDADETLTEPKKKYAYLLAELNKHCAKWISKHVEESPLIILTPVFVDYFNYLILLEKHFFPSTFKKETATKPAENGTAPSLSMLKSGPNGTGAPSLPPFSMTSSLFTAKAQDAEHKHHNGHKEKSDEEEKTLNGEEKPEADEKKLAETSKTFASLIKTQTQSFTPISISAAPAAPTPGLFFKPAEQAPKPDTTPKPEGGLFKFSSSATFATSTLPKSPPPADGTPKKPTIESSGSLAAKPGLFSSTASPAFKFGSTAAKTATPNSPPQPVPAATPLFGRSTEPAAVEAQPTATVTPSSNFFSFGNKPPASEAPVTANITPAATPAATPSTATFASLMSASAGTTGSVFKSFPAAGGSTTSIFSSSGSATPATTGATTPFFSFQSALGGKTPSIFGNATFGKNDSTATTTPSVFGSTSSIFGNATTPAFGVGTAATGETGEAEDEEYEPPKPESSDVKEEGSVFTKRIKLYYFNEAEKKFSDRGIGNLFLKPINNGESTQLIVRADTTLANILLNVKLTKLFPVSKAGAKDVSYVCVPNPPIPNTKAGAPCKFLFKVKTEQDATELFEKLNELKK